MIAHIYYRPHDLHANKTDNKVASKLRIHTQSVRTLKLRNPVGYHHHAFQRKSIETQRSLVITEPLTHMLPRLVSVPLTPLMQMLQQSPAMGLMKKWRNFNLNTAIHQLGKIYLYSKLRLEFQLIFLSASAYEKKALYILLWSHCYLFPVCGVQICL